MVNLILPILLTLSFGVIPSLLQMVICEQAGVSGGVTLTFVTQKQ
jgi:hypothetical protein